jgi:hypothetical protein
MPGVSSGVGLVAGVGSERAFQFSYVVGAGVDGVGRASFTSCRPSRGGGPPPGK